MAIVNGTLKDFGMGSLGGKSPTIQFIPSGNAYTPGGSLFATAPVISTPDFGGTFSVDLQPTQTLLPARWYTITITWLDSGGNFTKKDFPEWKLFVPPEGGLIGPLLQSAWNPTLAWWGPAEPAGTPVANTLWLETDTGDLSIWSN